MIEKKLKDYAHYYIGCRCVNSWFQNNHELYNNEWVLDGYREHSPKPFLLGNTETETWTDSIKLKLRRLGDITDEEMKVFFNVNESEGVYRNIECKKINGWQISYTVYTNEFNSHRRNNWHSLQSFSPSEYSYLVKLRFDLFGLIESGLAIDTSTLTK